MSIEVTNDISAVADRELAGEINRSLADVAKFKLLLAMLEDDVLSRPEFIDNEQSSFPSKVNETENHYRNAPLHTRPEDWQLAEVESKLLQQNSADLFLWSAMHPQPLSLYNDVMRINDDVKANCGFATQRRFKQSEDKHINVDSTRMYDVIQQARAN